MFKFLIIVSLLFLFTSSLSSVNNEELEKRYDQIAFLTTHNSYNAKKQGFWFPNHNWGIETQLEDGVRGLMIDVYEDEGDLIVYHGYKKLGSVPFKSILKKVKSFLDSNQNEVLTLILECYAKTDLMMHAFEDTGLSSYCYTKRKDQPWSTLDEMIQTNQRLVVFTDNQDTVKRENWYHYVWSHAVETDFSVHKTKHLCCDFNRGADDVNEKNLFIFNHFITRKRLGIGRKRISKKVNTYDFLLKRIQNCQAHTGKVPNFITVDFYSLGNAKAVVDFLNDSRS